MGEINKKDNKLNNSFFSCRLDLKDLQKNTSKLSEDLTNL